MDPLLSTLFNVDNFTIVYTHKIKKIKIYRKLTKRKKVKYKLIQIYSRKLALVACAIYIKRGIRKKAYSEAVLG